MPERPKQHALPGFEPEPEEEPAGKNTPLTPALSQGERGNVAPLTPALSQGERGTMDSTPALSGHHEVVEERGSDSEHSALPAGAEDGPAHSLSDEDGPARSSSSPTPNPQFLNPLSGKSVWVIDAHSLIHQVFHALPEMTSPRGEPVGAVFGFIRDMLFLLEEKRPDYLFCAFDLPGKTFRHELYTAYKEQRPEMDADLVPQIASCRRVLDVLGIPALGAEGFEADDVLATVARLTAEQGGACFIITADKDCRQLLSDKVRLFNIRKNEIFDAAALRADWGIAPEQVVDFQALVGDAVDNVPGVPLIGPKFARQLLKQYSTLENVLAHADEVPGAKKKENLKTYRDQAILSRDLVRLKTDVPVTIPWEQGRAGRIDRPAALTLLREFGFRSLAVKVDALAKKLNPDEGTLFGSMDDMDRMDGMDKISEPAFSRGIAPHPNPLPEGEGTAAFPAPQYHLVNTPQLFEQFLNQLRRQKCFSIDTETTDVRPRWAELVGMSFAWNDTEGWYLPVRSPPDESHLELVPTLTALRPILENLAIEKIGQNLKYDTIVLRGAGIELRGVGFDTMVASYLLEAGARTHNLDDLALHYLGHTTIKISELIGSGKNQKRMDEVPLRQIADYAGEDALIPWRLRPILAEKLAAADLEKLFTEVELPLIGVLADLETTGVAIDVPRLRQLSREYGEKLETLEKEIHALAGRDFNIASPKQLQQILFEELKLPVIKKTPKTGPSTDAEVLEELAPLHPLPAKLLTYRQYAKLKSTYVDALPELINPRTGRVHASFNQVVTATGRLSSSDPNLQNIPVRTEEGREIRSAFIANPLAPGDSPGAKWTLLAADYSQIELRVLAHFSEDENLCAAFARDEDIHARVASQVNGIPLEEVTPAMRRQAKAVNFGIVYGQSPFGLAKALGIEQEAAERFIDGYFAGYPGIEKFLDRILADCRKTGYVKTILGRRRAIEGVRDAAGRQRNLAERTAVNTVIQGSAADLIKLAMIAIARRLPDEIPPARMLLQIHDELIFEAPESHLSQLARLVAEEMAGVRTLKVPLKVDLKAGLNWADAEAFSLPG